MEKGQLIEQLDKFFKAGSVAVIGASSKPKKIGYEILRNLSQYDYKGRVYPINPKADKILNLKCYTSIQDVPDEIDLVVIAVSSVYTPQILEECGQKSVRACVIVSGGFKELGKEHAKIEEETLEIAKKYGIRIIGPNCIGIFDSETKIDTFFQSHDRMLRPQAGPVAFITQSGTFGATMLEWIAESELGISKFVSYGNRSDVDEADLIRYLNVDHDTKVITIYLESVGNGRKLVDAAKEALHTKPIVVLKSGRTELGSKSALSHTGQLAGSYAVCEGVFKQTGLIMAENLEELFDMTKALATQPIARGNRVAMVTNGAGPCVMAVDECVKRKIGLSEFKEETVKKLKSVLPSYCIVGNPVDLTGSATAHEYELTMEILLKDSNVDLLMPFFVFQDTPLDEKILDIIPEFQKYGKPIVCCASGGAYTKKQSKILEKKGVPVYPIPERAVAAAYSLIRYGKVLETKDQK
jgi:acetyl coenzyme A synthetase (ADP forming)-like protein